MATSSTNYTRPELRERLKEKIKAESRGGKAGQWTARKAQRLAQEYRKSGGGYAGEKNKAQKSLEKWTEQSWQSADGRPARRQTARGETTARYLPKEAWERLSPAQRKATDGKKRKGSAQGRRTVRNTKSAKKARAAVASGGKDRDTVISEFKKLVNLTPSRLEKWLSGEDSKRVGFRPAKAAESIGHESGRKIVELKRKKKSKLDQEDIKHMKKVISYIKRHLAQKPRREPIDDSKWRYSLMNWGHDPVKKS